MANNTLTTYRAPKKPIYTNPTSSTNSQQTGSGWGGALGAGALALGAGALSGGAGPLGMLGAAGMHIGASHLLNKYSAPASMLAGIHPAGQIALAGVPMAAQFALDMNDARNSKQVAKRGAQDINWTQGLGGGQGKSVEKDLLSRTPGYISTGIKSLASSLPSALSVYSMFPEKSSSLIEDAAYYAKKADDLTGNRISGFGKEFVASHKYRAGQKMAMDKLLGIY